MDQLGARGSLLETLRLSRSLTQVELARLSGIPQATLSKAESGGIELERERWQAIASALNVPTSAFEDAQSPIAPARVFHRKQRSTPIGAVKKIGADAALAQQRISDLFGPWATSLVRHDLEDGFVTPQEVARVIRSQLGVHDEPIRDLIGLIEDAGVIVLLTTLDSVQVDAIATWPDDAVPVILIADHVSTERMRFTLAHELGHAVMHDAEAMELQERQADEFAAEFLLPAKRLLQEWPSDPTLDSLVTLKRRWGVSLAALMRRAADVGAIGEPEYRGWSINLATSGMHRREPSPMPREHPRRLAAAVELEKSRGETLETLAARAHMDPREFTTSFLETEHTA